MQYLCLVLAEEGTVSRLAPEERKTLDRDSLDYDRELMASGHFIAAHALKPVREAATVKVRGNDVSVTDGPFAETKEQVGGFILIEARDLNEAIQIATKIPMARYGAIEVRPVFNFGPG
jgi:hypothetical protein